MRRPTIALAVLALLQAPPALRAQATRPSEPLDIGGRRQVFVDGRFMPVARNVRLVVHPPCKTRERTINTDKPWEKGGIGPYSSVLKDGDVYHMWYHVMSDVQWHIAKEAGAICYARSKDGITWEKPDLGIVEYNGSKANNIVIGHGAAGMKIGQDGGMVFIDPKAPTEERYRMLLRHEPAGEGLHLFSSGDGIHWKLTHPSVLTARPQAKGHHLDSQNVMFYDDRLDKYVAYVRKNLNEADTQGRSVARGESDKLGGFPVAQDMKTVIGPEPKDRWVDYYTSEAIKYPWAGDAYYMFPQVYFHYIGGAMPEFPDRTPTNAGPLDTQFAASRDGIHWERFERQPFIRLGQKGEFDWASVRMIYGLVPDVAGREMYMYYRASDWLHGWDRNEENKQLLTGAGLGADQNIAVISRVVLRRDGFISVRAAQAEGEIVSQAIRFTGKRLVLNIDTSATGTARVELQNAAGEALPGFAAADCDMIHTANMVNRPVSWKGKGDVSSLAGKPVRIRFILRATDLYAFQFTE